MTESEFNIGKELLKSIKKAEDILESLAKMKSATKEKNFRAGLVAFIDDDEQGEICFTQNDKKIFTEIMDKLIQEEERIISSLKEQFDKL